MCWSAAVVERDRRLGEPAAWEGVTAGSTPSHRPQTGPDLVAFMSFTEVAIMPIHRLVGARPRPRPFQVVTTYSAMTDDVGRPLSERPQWTAV